MPHVSEVRATSHDRHDTMLVAALAAGDLAGTDRDQAIALTDTCAECSSLHADLIAIAHATATLPPPIASAGRDFTITPAQAARLRPAGWRRYVGSPRLSFARPLGVTLATFGLIGLLIGNVPLGFGSSAASPMAAGAGAESAPRDAAASTADVTTAGEAAPAGLPSSGAAVPAASAAAASAAPAASAAASGGAAGAVLGAASPSTRLNGSAYGAASGGVGVAGGITPGAESAGVTSPDKAAQPSMQQVESGGASSPAALLNIASVVAVIAGLALLIASRRRRPVTG